MKNLKKSIVPVLLLGFVTLFVVGCGGDDKKSSLPGPISPDNYDRQSLLSNLANNYIVPAYNEYKIQTTNLKNEVVSFNLAPSPTALQALKNQWEQTLLVWQDVAFLELGPAANISLRSQTNVYPADVTVINSNISSGVYDLQLPSNFDAKGFQALDYLIDVINYYNNTPNAKIYLQDVVSEIENNATSINNIWQTSYVTTFVDNSASNAQGSAVSDMINALVLHYETFIRKGKVGLPAGVFNGFSQVPLPDHVEALYYEQSLPFVHRSLVAIQKFINGESYGANTNGEGLDDYLKFVNAKSGGQPLELVIDSQIDLIKIGLTGLNDPFSNEVTVKNSDVRDVYQEMQKLVPLLKVETTDALDVLITFQDNDGD